MLIIQFMIEINRSGPTVINAPVKLVQKIVWLQLNLLQSFFPVHTSDILKILLFPKFAIAL